MTSPQHKDGLALFAATISAALLWYTASSAFDTARRGLSESLSRELSEGITNHLPWPARFLRPSPAEREDMSTQAHDDSEDTETHARCRVSRLPTSDNICGTYAEHQIWALANCERRARSLSPLTCSLELQSLGRSYAQELSSRAVVSHTSAQGEGLSQRLASVQGGFVFGENLAAAESSEAAHIGWMNSPAHRQNILSEDFTSLGVGAERETGGRYLFTQLFSDGGSEPSPY